MSDVKAESKGIEPSLLEAWQRHVLQCTHCSGARAGQDLCTMGQNFWRIPGSATLPVESILSAPVVHAPQSVVVVQRQEDPRMPPPSVQAMVMAAPAVFDLSALAARVSEKVIARSQSGAAIAVPMEKTSSSVEIRTSRDVVLRMPERDVEVYSVMKTSIARFVRLAEALGTCILASDEARVLARSAGVVLDDSQMSMVVRQAADSKGMGGVTLEALYSEFSDVALVVIRLGDAMGRFMNVDAETRAVMKEVRSLGVDMRGELERSIGSRLLLDDSMRQITRGLRMLAVTLQGEMERRLGT